MISVPYRCVFVKVPKTAGTSISDALRCTHVGKPHRDLLEIRSWARSRARRDRHCRTKPIGTPDARERTTDAREPETG